MDIVSIIMPAYNAEKTIVESIKSVISQTHQEWELIILDDGSKDNTVAEITNEFLVAGKDKKRDARIILLTRSENAGVARTRNDGIKIAKGKWLAFLDSDDIWREDKLEKQIKFMKDTGANIAYTATAYMNSDGDMFEYVLRAKRELTYKKLLRRNLMSCSSVMVSRDAMLPFPEEGRLHEDYVIWLTIVKQKGVANGLDEPLLVYRLSKGSKSGSRLKSAEMIYNAYKHPMVGYGRVVALFFTVRYSAHSIGKRLKMYKRFCIANKNNK